MLLSTAIRRFWNDHRGYVIALTLISMPMLLGFSLLVIDVGRSGNLHTDLQNAVDAMALTGARELDGRDDAIARAEAAIEKLANTAAFGGGGAGMSLGSSLTVTYDAGDDAASTVTVTFLKAIPDNDDDPIAGSMVTTDSNEAAYAWVAAKEQAMQTIFPLPVGFTRGTINVSADAVAVYRASACDVTPIYICNPFENPAGGDAQAAADEFHQKFAAGDLYGLQIELRNSGSYEPGPGNFGFLRTSGNGANVLAAALGSGSPGVCYKQDDLDTEPGAIVGPVEHGLNTRFGLYGGSFNKENGDPRFRPANNVRMAQQQSGKSCTTYSPEQEAYNAVPLGYGATMQDIPGGGGKIATANNWNLDMYWDITHSGQNPSPLKSNPSYTPPVAPAGTISSYSSSYPGGSTPSGVNPSAYDVYNYELGNANLLANTAPSGETGIPQCHKNYGLADYPDSVYGDRREIFAAIVNCVDQDPQGQDNIEALAFARMFLVKPAYSSGDDRYMTLETIDITGQGGRGTLDEFLREEAELVR
ncbi:TadE/TadG family type IV pilus assembly protein [Pararhizobium sp. LjRoot238]|uniref:TadE/TadG family type IV pilus assembly protein n=1 Tax=Pararhizobium sp. LjRoot238 TaxID=3342293 RepID=UPI003ECD682E